MRTWRVGRVAVGGDGWGSHLPSGGGIDVLSVVRDQVQQNAPVAVTATGAFAWLGYGELLGFQHCLSG